MQWWCPHCCLYPDTFCDPSRATHSEYVASWGGRLSEISSSSENCQDTAHCSVLADCFPQNPFSLSTPAHPLLVPWLSSPCALIPLPTILSHQCCCCALPAAISCPALDAPSHGHLNCSHPHGNFTFNSTCSFSCKEGFIQMGAEMLRCSATGNWTRHPPVCEGMVGLCFPASCSTSWGWRRHPASLSLWNSFDNNLSVCGPFSEDSAAFLKQVLVYTSTSALAAIGLVLSGTLIALLAKQLSDRGTETPVARGCFGLGLSDQVVTEPQGKSVDQKNL